jgi:hypothetical protein
VKTYVADQRWSELTTSINTLLGENTSEEFSNIVKVIEDTLIPQAEYLFRSGEWDKARTLLKLGLFSPKVRSQYYISYIDQAYALNKTHPLKELKSQLPANSRTGWLDTLGQFVDSKMMLDHTMIGYAKEEVNKIVMDPNFNPTQVL